MICELEGLGVSLNSVRGWEPQSRGCDLYKLPLLVTSSADETLIAESLCRRVSHAGDDLLLVGASCLQLSCHLPGGSLVSGPLRMIVGGPWLVPVLT